MRLGVAVLSIVFIVPLLEELLKAAGPAILIARRQRGGMMPTKSLGPPMGFGGRRGYAFTENMFNTQSAVANFEGVFSLLGAAMLLRAGTSLMHMIATGTIAVGWYYALVSKRPTRLVLFLLAALTAHGLWNTSALLLGGVQVEFLRREFGLANRCIGRHILRRRWLHCLLFFCFGYGH